jgi:3-keto-5-aminohexanoate cleavage enzyme
MFDLKRNDWTTLPSRNELMKKRASRELDHPPSPDIQPRWDISESVVVGAAVSGRIVRERAVTRNFALDFDSFTAEAASAIEAGAAMVHLDPGGIDAIMNSGLSVPAIYDKLYNGILKRTSKDWVPDFNILRGANFAENMYPLTSGMCETVPMAPNFPPEWMESTARVVTDHGGRVFFSIHSTGEVDLANRLIISKGILPKPLCWIVLIGYPFDDATDRVCTYLAHPRAMLDELTLIVDRIHEIDPSSCIMVCGSGRAGHYLVTAAMMLGLHVRVGTEDMAFRFPHKNELLESNRECLERVQATGNALGRRFATPDEFRGFMGISKSKGHEERRKRA